MAGFFGLFGNKSKYLDEVTEQDRNQPNQKGEAYFLDADEAKSFGNIEFMRKPNKIRRTFPKIGESIKEISSIKKNSSNGNGIAPTTTSSNGTKPATPANPSQNERRSSDDSMDMFRQMARDIKKP
ncbi:hypothetical protein HC931_17935 [Candidatus Gracilibacteria bacterium]|jgi:hypothetical protein|nr:hypothetical protein [Candidatus Gracilibacteria bacterium]NJM88358.1 hypothetical protein [Hydrococcus sp. RU_2_2]NJP20253.1 hypothetical protein [Hydrococcus sp. CRU_1_1]